MTQEIAPPLGPPPRKAHYRRGIRNVRRAYRTLFALIILVFAGWAALDVMQWYDLAPGNDAFRTHALYLAIGHGLIALITLFVLRYIERPLRRELRLARRGVLVPGQLLAVHSPRRRRGSPSIAYTFKTVNGATIEGSCAVPRRFHVNQLTPGMAIDVLYEPHDPERNRPRLCLEHVEFGDAGKKKPASA